MSPSGSGFLDPVVFILSLLRHQSVQGKGLTLSEIRKEMEEYDLFAQYRFFRRIRGIRYFGEVDDWLVEVLQSLSDLGLVEADDFSNAPSDWLQWRASSSWIKREPPSGGNGDGGGIGPVLSRPEDDDGEGGGGIRETLGHPVLFALPKRDFEALVRDLFDEAQ